MANGQFQLHEKNNREIFCIFCIFYVHQNVPDWTESWPNDPNLGLAGFGLVPLKSWFCCCWTRTFFPLRIKGCALPHHIQGDVCKGGSECAKLYLMTARIFTCSMTTWKIKEACNEHLFLLSDANGEIRDKHLKCQQHTESSTLIFAQKNWLNIFDRLFSDKENVVQWLWKDTRSKLRKFEQVANEDRV